MMKYKYFLLAIVLLWSCSMAHAQWRSASAAPQRQGSEISKIVKDQGDGKVLYSYCSSVAAVTAKSGIGFDSDEDIEVTAAIRLSKGIVSLLKGRNIYRLRLGAAGDTDEATVFIQNADGTVLWQITKALELGWNDIVLETPLVIPGDQELYIGFTCIQHSKEFIIARESGTAKTNGMFLAADDGLLTEISTLGNLCLAVEVDGTESEFGYVASIVKAYSPKPYLLKGTDQSTDVNIIFLNEGENNISKVKLGRVFNDTELSDTICYFKRTVRANSISELTLKVVPTESGKYVFTLKELEDTPVSAPSVVVGVSLYDAEDVVERVVLIEEFTSQDCGNCPPAQKALHKLITGYEDRVAMVLHHSGYNPDVFTIPESMNYCYFYNSLETFAPGMALDRTYLSEYDSNGTGTLVLDPRSLSKSTFAKELALPAMVSVGIACSYDEATRKLTVEISGHKITDLVGEHVGLTVLLLESNYMARQSGITGDFEHNNFPRAVLSDATGDIITFNGDGTYSKRYVYTIPETYTSITKATTTAHPENMNIVAFVSNFDMIYPDNCIVLNANKTTSLNQGEVTGLKSESVLAQSLPVYAKDGKVYVYGEYDKLQVYNLQGMPVLNENLQPGAYIVRITSLDQKEHVRKVLVRN